MTEKLAALFDLPPQNKQVVDALENATALENSMPQQPEDSMDKELDDLADMAVESFENLQSLGMNVEARFSAPIFDAASKMLGHAVTAKLGKVQKKLKQAELALKIEKMNYERNQDDGGINVEAQVFDRNELLKTFRKQ